MSDLPAVRSNLAVTPAAAGATCSGASSLRPRGRDKLKEGGVLDLVGRG